MAKYVSSPIYRIRFEEWRTPFPLSFPVGNAAGVEERMCVIREGVRDRLLAPRLTLRPKNIGSSLIIRSF